MFFSKCRISLPSIPRLCSLITLFACINIVHAADVNTETQKSKSSSSSKLAKAAANFQPTQLERDAGAVVLFNHSSLYSNGDGYIDSEKHVGVALLNDKAAEEYGEIRIGFNSFYETAELEFARILDENGEVRTVSGDAIKVFSENKAANYSDMKTLKFALPAARKGSFIEFKVKYKTVKPIIPGYWWNRRILHYIQHVGSNNSYRFDPVREFKTIINVPQSEKIKFIKKIHDVNMQKVVDGDRVIHNWSALNLSEIKHNSYIGEWTDFVPSVTTTTIPKWKDIDDWAGNIYLQPKAVDSSVKSKLEEIVTGKMSRQEKIENIYYYIQDNIRYIFAHVDRGGFVPHDVKDILHNRYGDCKDQTTLMTALLNAAGIEAYPALIGTFPDPGVEKDLPLLSFSHMITYVPDAKGGIWLDTSGDTGMFPGIDWTLKSRSAFVINGKGGALKELPGVIANENSANVDVSFQAVGDNLRANIKINSTGHISNSWRANHKHNPNAEESLRRTIKSFYTKADLISVEVSSGLKGRKPFSVDAVIEFKDAWKKKQESVAIGGNLSQILTIFTDFMNLPSPDMRDHDYHIGRVFNLKMNVSIVPPSNEYEGIFIKSGKSLHSKNFAFTHSESKDKDTVVVGMEFEVLIPKVEVEDYKSFYENIKMSTDNSQWEIRYVLNKKMSEENSLLGDLEDSSSGPDSYIKLARHYLSVADYEQAEKNAREAVDIDSNNGEAVYVLGLAMGFLDNYDESDRLIKKSTELGYSPWDN